ncbi:PEP-CTERM sorting domain-containing protein [Rugamonas rivuli]|nr:PEP-CTERM sorting domain-containing protein [Rugamonas rivuli]
MTIKFNTAIKAAAVAAALAFSSVGQAASITGEMPGAVEYLNFDANFFGNIAVTITPWKFEIGGVETLAFCIDQDTSAVYHVNYGATPVVPSQAIMGLYETNYKYVLNNGVYNADKAAAFQLALWELKDDQSFTNPTGNMVLPLTGGLNPGNDALAADAYAMLADALNYHGLGGSYLYTEYTAAGTQSLMGVSAVPEADTWAMMAVGLGLVGLIGRRKSEKSEKFA